MQSSLITPALDLTKYAWRQRHGDIQAIGTWWLGDAHRAEGYWPCLVLLRDGGGQPCVVTLDLAWIWSEEEGSPEFALDTAKSFALSLGMPQDWPSIYRITSIIRDHIEDLIKRIPPRPTSHQNVVADIIVKDKQTGKERCTEIKDD